MNYLEVFAIFMVVFLDLSIRDARNWMRHMQPREVLDWFWAIYHGLGLCGSSISVVYLATHRANIQPAPTWLSWTLGLGLAVAILGFVMRLAANAGRHIRQLGR
jgi:heme/copper-type cytochrome/quinol oxidase subunit 3